MSDAPTVLYLTYHGLASPLGRAQCLPYLLRLAKTGAAKMLVVSFESDPLPGAEMRTAVRGAGIEWIELRVSPIYELAEALEHARRHRGEVLALPHHV